MLERAQRVHEATIEDIQAELSGALTEVGFAKNAATILEPDGRAAIQQIAHVLRKYDFVYVCVEGHAQRQEAKPRKLSEDRAQVVTKELTVAVRLVLSCLVLSCLVLSCLALAWLVLSCLSVG
jgi:outer membrane protein OmpA-like peptidoglycan-associated protein